MPRGRLNEKTVQRAAVAWLLTSCVEELDVVSIIPALEVGVSKKSKLGYGRADGLVVARLKNNSIFIAAIEAKSGKTRRNIQPNYRDKKLLLQSPFQPTLALP